MTIDLSRFAFDRAALGEGESDFVAGIPAGFSSRDQLFQALRDGLNFPDYFGYNWDALTDCLGDLSWIAERRVIIAHEDLPQLDRDALVIYLEILCDCVAGWNGQKGHELIVAFPKAVLGQVQVIADA
nr:Barstar (barnase inhibitor) [uncultured bacterium]